MSSVVRADTVVLQTEHLPSLSEFYEDGLGLPVVQRDLEAGRVTLDAAGSELILVQRGADEERVRNATRVVLPGGDLEATRRRLRGLNVTFWEGIDASGDLDGIVAQDPEGNSLWYVRDARDDDATTGSLVRGQGECGNRRDLMIYGGACGALVGAAVSAGVGSDDAEKISVSGATGAILGVLLGRRYSVSRMPSVGTFKLLILAGNYGSGQGLGWSEAADANDRTSFLTAAAGGLASLYLASEILKKVQISSCQSEVMHSATYWGAWSGFLAERISSGRSTRVLSDDQRRDRALSAMLWGSTAGFAAGTLWSLNHDADTRRVRIINLGGVIGTVVGFGVAELVDDGDERKYFAAPLAGGFVGMTSAAVLTRHRDVARSASSLGSRWSMPISTGWGRGGSLRIPLIEMHL